MRLVKSKQGYHLIMNDGDKSWLEYILDAYEDSIHVTPDGGEMKFIDDYKRAKEEGSS